MTYRISIVTFNRRQILEKALDAIEATCTEPHVVHITENGSTDGTADMLREREQSGQLIGYYLPENIGEAPGRNVHWAHCIGHDAVRFDDKVLPLAPGWLTALSVQAQIHHALVGIPYAEETLFLKTFAPMVPYTDWPQDHGVGGPLIFVPGAVSAALGMTDTFPGLLYGWSDMLYIERARLLGWHYGYALGVPVDILARAGTERKAHAEAYLPAVQGRLAEYREGRRDVYIPTD